MNQREQVIEIMRRNGGFATLRQLNEKLDFSTWKTKTPEASVRRIVQVNNDFFKIQPGLWALEECREQVLEKFQLKEGDKRTEEMFSHGYYQGLLVEIGKMRHYITYVPAQDKNRLFINEPLGKLSDSTTLPEFSGYTHILSKARTVDVIWFNHERMMPAAFYEVEHSTDIKNSLGKFYELQDFYALFRIVADKSRKKEFEDKIQASIYDDIRQRVKFLSYDSVANTYESLNRVKDIDW